MVLEVLLYLSYARLPILRSPFCCRDERLICEILNGYHHQFAQHVNLIQVARARTSQEFRRLHLHRIGCRGPFGGPDLLLLHEGRTASCNRTGARFVACDSAGAPGKGLQVVSFNSICFPKFPALAFVMRRSGSPNFVLIKGGRNWNLLANNPCRDGNVFRQGLL